MNEPRFIELLNLYVDQQLSAEEASELEAEIQQNPARHRTYQQYCRMQRACTQLFEHERTAAPSSTALSRAMADADRKVVAFPERSRRPAWSLGFSFAAVAAAACVAFVVVRQTDGTGKSIGAGAEFAASEKTPVTVTAPGSVALVTAEPAPVQVEEFKSVFTAQSIRIPAKPAMFFVNASGQDDLQLLDWTHQVQLKPLRKVSAEEFAFETRAATKTPTMLFSPTTTNEPAKEQAAFTFTK